MTAPLGAGYGESAQDIRTAISNFSRQDIQLNESSLALINWLNLKNSVPSGATITELEQWFLDDYNQRRPGDTSNATNAHADYLQVMQWVQEMGLDLEFATTGVSDPGIVPPAVTDNTQGTAPVVVTIPPGQVQWIRIDNSAATVSTSISAQVGCILTTVTDPKLRGIHDEVGVDSSQIINSAAPPQF